MEIPDHLTCLLRNLYAGQEATVRSGNETTDWFEVGKGVRQGCILSPCLFDLHEECSMQNASLDESQAEIKTARRNINNFIYAEGTTLATESEEELKNLLMRMKEESERAGLKLNIQKLRSWHPVPSLHAKRWGESGNSDRFNFLGLQKRYKWSLQPWNLKMIVPRKKSIDKGRQCFKRQRHHFANDYLYCQSYGSSSSHVHLWEFDDKESWKKKKVKSLIRVRLFATPSTVAY